MDDLISKLSEIRSEYNCFDEDGEPQYRALSEAIRILSQLADGDTISRKAAIDVLARMMPRSYTPDGSHPADEEIFRAQEVFADCIEALEILPSAQPEPFTDTEQRIFLAAMGREEKVCKQVDDECRDCREPYEDSLVRTCHEIVRKVKGALWT